MTDAVNVTGIEPIRNGEFDAGLKGFQTGGHPRHRGSASSTMPLKLPCRHVDKNSKFCRAFQIQWLHPRGNFPFSANTLGAKICSTSTRQMDSIRDQIPSAVFASVQRHLIMSGNKAEEGYPSGEEDEDTLTGDMFGAFRKPWTTQLVDGAEWRWRFTCRKFRGRGELATEHVIGADGIVQVEVFTPSVATRKGVLFQAKKNWHHRDSRLIDQVEMMERFAYGGSAVFNYGSDGYTAESGIQVLEDDGRPPKTPPPRLGHYLAEEFLLCKIGRFDTFYDWDGKQLVLSGDYHPFVRITPKFVTSLQISATGNLAQGR